MKTRPKISLEHSDYQSSPVEPVLVRYGPDLRYADLGYV